MAGWRDRIVETVQMDPRDLTPNPMNWRVHPDQQAAVLGGLLREVGTVAPVIYNRVTRRLVDGHLRVKMAVAEGIGTVPVSVVDLTEEEERKVLLAFDPIAAMADADADAMRDLAEQIETEDPALRSFIDQLLSEVPIGDEGDEDGDGRQATDAGDLGGPDERDADRLRAKWGTEAGQVWRIEAQSVTGAHVLVIGDALDPAVAKLLMRGDPAALMVTSPPYWANQEYDRPSTRAQIRDFMLRVGEVWHDQVTRRIVVQTGSTTTTAAAGRGDQGKASGKPAITSEPFQKILLDAMWADALATVGWLTRYRRFWLKSGMMLHPGPVSDLINEGVEVMICCYRAGHNEGGQERVDEDWALAGWWELPGVRGDGHPCPFHPEIPVRNIRLYSVPGDRVVDPFSGQGTTIEACEALGRLGRGVEQDPGYAAVCLERLALMGLAPTQVG